MNRIDRTKRQALWNNTVETAYTSNMRKLKLYTILGIIFVVIAGSLSHFLYDWSGHNVIAGLFTPVNESIWEHMKLLFFPMLLYSFFMIRRLRREYPCLISALCFGILAGTFLIPALYYAYSSLLGRDFFLLDIAIFVFSTAAAFLLTRRLTLSCRLQPYTALLISLTCLLFACFLLFTYRPPSLGIFADPTTCDVSLRCKRMFTLF